MKKLTISELNAALPRLKGWEHKNEFLKKEFVFKDHKAAFSFISTVAMIAEKMGHHPDWSGVFNKVVIKLSTHEAQGVTKNDIDFATEIENSL